METRRKGERVEEEEDLKSGEEENRKGRRGERGDKERGKKEQEKGRSMKDIRENKKTRQE